MTAANQNDERKTVDPQVLTTRYFRVFEEAMEQVRAAHTLSLGVVLRNAMVSEGSGDRTHGEEEWELVLLDDVPTAEPEG